MTGLGYVDSAHDAAIGGWFLPEQGRTCVAFVLEASQGIKKVSPSPGRENIPGSVGFHFTGISSETQIQILTGTAKILALDRPAEDEGESFPQDATPQASEAFFERNRDHTTALSLGEGFIAAVINRLETMIACQAPEHRSSRKLDRLLARSKAFTKLHQSIDFTIENEGYYLDLHLRDGADLVVTFESGGFEKEGADRRQAWGADYFREKGISFIGVKPTWNNWYLAPPLGKVFQRLQPILRDYDQVMTYGSSMGGFAALAYCDVLGAKKVLAFCPQSARSSVICPWENVTDRELKEADFISSYSDAVGNYTKAQSVYIFTDLHNLRDRLHAARLIAPNVNMINTPYLGHAIPLFLYPMGLLGSLPLDILYDRFSKPEFYDKLRKRRNLKRYFNVLEEKTASRPTFSEIVAAHRAVSPLIGLD